MNDRRINGFFYGLYMDQEILQTYGIEVTAAKQAYVEDFTLIIGNRATTVQCSGSRTYGMIISMTHEEMDKLYKAPGLESYRPEAVLARTLVGESIPVLCYNLLQAPEPNERNPEYASKLRDVLAKLEFPHEYVESFH